MKTKKITIIFFFALIFLIFSVQPANAVPTLPSSFYGTVKVNGINVPAGTTVIAKINGTQYAATTVFSYEADTVFILDVPGDQSDTPGIEGGIEGDTILFFIDAIQADQTGTWHSGTNVGLNLTGTGSLTFHIYLPMIMR